VHIVYKKILPTFWDISYVKEVIKNVNIIQYNIKKTLKNRVLQPLDYKLYGRGYLKSEYLSFFSRTNLKAS